MSQVRNASAALCSKTSSSGDEESAAKREIPDLDEGHLAMTYAALATLATLGDDLDSIDTEATVRTIRALQREDGRWELGP